MSGPDKAAAEPSIVGPADPISIAGDLGRRATTVTSCGVSLAVALGRNDAGDTFLVPFLECAGDLELGEDDTTRSVRAALTFDNVAFVMKRVAAEYVTIVEPLAQMSKGDLLPERSRVQFAAEALEAAARDLASAARGLRELEHPDSWAE